MSADRWVPLGVLGRARGLGGECWFRPFNADTDALHDGATVRLVRDVGAPREATVEALVVHGDAISMKLVGVDDRSAAEAVTGARVELRRGDFPPLDEGEFYHVDLVGLAVRAHDGSAVGTVARVASYPSVDALVVTTADGEREVPLVDDYVASLDLADGVTLTADALDLG
ncbi:MAG: ribosome maturation factor RimM [Polyangiales bacterium]